MTELSPFAAAVVQGLAERRAREERDLDRKREDQRWMAQMGMQAHQQWRQQQQFKAQQELARQQVAQSGEAARAQLLASGKFAPMAQGADVFTQAPVPASDVVDIGGKFLRARSPEELQAQRLAEMEATTRSQYGLKRDLEYEDTEASLARLEDMRAQGLIGDTEYNQRYKAAYTRQPFEQAPLDDLLLRGTITKLIDEGRSDEAGKILIDFISAKYGVQAQARANALFGSPAGVDSVNETKANAVLGAALRDAERDPEYRNLSPDKKAENLRARLRNYTNDNVVLGIAAQSIHKATAMPTGDAAGPKPSFLETMGIDLKGLIDQNRNRPR